MIVKLLTEHHLEFLSLTGGCRGSSESTLVKIPHCWKSHVVAQIPLFLSSAVRLQVSSSRMRQDLLFNCQRRLEYLGSRLQDLAMELGDGQGAVWLKSNMW